MSRYRDKTIFYIFLLLPLVISILVPILWYSQPMMVRVGHNVYQLDASDILRALGVALLWLLLSSVSFLLPVFSRNCTSVEKKIENTQVLNRKAVLFTSIVALLIFLVHQFIQFWSSLELLVHVLSYSAFAIAVLAIAVSTNHGMMCDADIKTLRILAIVIVTILCMVPIILGNAAPVAMVLYALIYAMFLCRFKFSKIVLSALAAATLILVCMAIKGYIRYRFYDGPFQRIHISQIISNDTAANNTAIKKKIKRNRHSRTVYAKRVEKFRRYDPNYNLSRIPAYIFPGNSYYFVARAMHRANKLGDLAYMVKVTPEKIPYSRWRTYKPHLLFFIPRVLWKNKPVDDSGQYYGHRYRYLQKWDKSTSVNMNPVSEAWMSFGVSGVILSAILFGLLINLVYSYLLSSNRLLHIIVTSLILASTLTSEAVSGAILRNILIMAIMYWFLFYVARQMYAKMHEQPS